MNRLTTASIATLLILSSCGREPICTDQTDELTAVGDTCLVDVVEYESLVKQLPPLVEIEPEVEVTTEEVELIEFRVTAYCACEICCGKWALNRPLDENGDPIVYGAWGKELTHRYSVASPLPFGTKIDLGELGVVEVQDRTADWIVDKHGEYIVDLYMTDHEEAWNFGVQYIKGELIEQ